MSSKNGHGKNGKGNGVGERTPAQVNARARESVAAIAERAAAQGRFLDKFREVGIVLKACQDAQVGRRTVYGWLERDEAFKTLYLEAAEDASDRCEAEALRRGVDGWDEPVYQGGEQVGTIRKFSDRMLELTLKARRPERFRERHEHTGAGGGPIQVHKRVTFGGRYKPQPADA